jgi:thymidylate kinase
MDCTPDQIFRRYFAELERVEMPYVLLHSYHEFPEVVRSDVDYAVRDQDLNRAYEILRSVATNAGWEVVQTLQYDIAAYYSVLVDPEHPARFIKMDRSSHYTRNGCSFIDVSVLLEGRRKYKDFFIPAPSSEFIYTLAKAFAKSKDIGRFIPYLKELWQTEPVRSQKLFAGVFGSNQGRLETWFDRPAEEWQLLNQPMHDRNRFGIAERWREFRRIWQRVSRPTGLRVALLGPDGAGKSTVIGHLQTLLEPCFRFQRMIHFCPMLLRKRTEEVVCEPHALPARSTVISWIKVVYYFLDHWVDYLLHQWSARVRSTCIIFDRDFNDILVDPTRYRIRNSRPLTCFLRRLLPPTDLTLVLDAEPETIHKRKPELPMEEVQRQRTVLRNLAASSGNWVVLSAEAASEEVGRAAWRRVVDYIAKREETRHNPVT